MLKKPSIFLKRWSRPDCLFWFAAFWAIIQFGLILAEFLHWNIVSIPFEMPLFYGLIVLLYVLRKNTDAWLEKIRNKRPGEYFLIGWWLGLLAMFVIQILSRGAYIVPKRMLETCLIISVPYIVSEYLKARQALTRNGREKSGKTQIAKSPHLARK
ncbi:MAG: hypothetical protein WC544_04705 [Patescibacteria group bacterium]